MCRNHKISQNVFPNTDSITVDVLSARKITRNCVYKYHACLGGHEFKHTISIIHRI